ncbi:Hypothetical predicted protein [Olea europaea subsp. europaea]|uniref:Uncharacterized protein n=1 Tax=Olea europaea subsp. europaea TaxID=158383 RepID=A0A8S0SGE9_OLEEU|nr:Hypothetical predicted protein [Olea europaea subsp. europaea]
MVVLRLWDSSNDVCGDGEMVVVSGAVLVMVALLGCGGGGGGGGEGSVSGGSM